MDISSIALQGLQQSETQLQNAAADLASGAASPGADLAADIVSLNSAQTQAAVDISALKVAGQLQQSLLDILA